MVIKYFAYYRNITGRKEEALLLGPVSAIKLLKELCVIHGRALEKELLSGEGNEISPNLIFLVDGRNIDFLNGSDTIIGDNAVISLFPRIAGG